MSDSRKFALGWTTFFLTCALLGSLSFAYFDMPIAGAFAKNLGQLNTWGTRFGTEVLLSIEAVIALFVAAMRLVRGHGNVTPFGKALALASVTSVFAYATNDSVLKLLLGVPNPQNVLILGMHHSFHLFAGSQNSSFPSGHMVLAGSFAGIFMRLYPKFFWLFAVLLAIAASALVIGDWHFVSDVIAGTFIGVSGGLLSGQLWQDHTDPDD